MSYGPKNDARRTSRLCNFHISARAMKQYGEIVQTQPRPVSRESQDGDDDGDCRDKTRDWHHPVKAEAILPQTDTPAERGQGEEEQGDA